MQLVNPLPIVESIGLACGICVLAAIFLGLMAFFISSRVLERRIYDRPYKKLMVIEYTLKSFIAIFIISAIVIYGVGQSKLTENREQMNQFLEERGYEALEPNDFSFKDHDIHEFYALRGDSGSEVFQLAYRIGRCDCYFDFYRVVDGEMLHMN